MIRSFPPSNYYPPRILSPKTALPSFLAPVRIIFQLHARVVFVPDKMLAVDANVFLAVLTTARLPATGAAASASATAAAASATAATGVKARKGRCELFLLLCVCSNKPGVSTRCLTAR